MARVPDAIEGTAPHADSFLTSGLRKWSHNASGHSDVALAATSGSERPCTLTGKIPTNAALQREHEYMDWVATLPKPARDDQSQDDSWTAFMADRRQHSERERLRN